MGREKLNGLIAQAITLFAHDTVFTGLGVMQAHRIGRVAVVREHDGALLGEITVEDLYRAWAKDPFMTVEDVIAGGPGASLGWAIFGGVQAVA